MFNEATIATEAFDAARKATQEHLTKHGDRDACGFAWVTVKPANSKFARYLKAKDLASKASGGGLCVWNPSGSSTQAITAKEVGAAAFADVLTKYGIKAYFESRMD